jgi:translation initiation factor 2 subunit 2
MCDNDDYGMGGSITSFKQQEKNDHDIREFEQSLKHKRKKKRKPKSQQHKPMISRMNMDMNTDEKGNELEGAATNFTYTQLLKRIYGELNTDIDESDLAIPAPKVFRHGSKKTVWPNMVEIARFLQRDANHLKRFVEAELTTDTNFDGSRYLILTGRWTDANIRSVVTKYTNSFVLCENCKSLNTTMSRNNSTRLFEINCNKCHSQRCCKRIENAFRTIANKAQRIQQRQQAQLQRQRQT